MKTSAKTGQGVDETFLEMTKSLIKKQNSMSQEEKDRLGVARGGAKGLIGAKNQA